MNQWKTYGIKPEMISTHIIHCKSQDVTYGKYKNAYPWTVENSKMAKGK